MSKIRKPIPKTQKQLSVEQQKAFDTERGNPNARINPNESETGIDFNRSTKLSFKGDSTKPFSIGIQDLDEAVFYYFKNVIKPFVFQNGERRNVPVIYGSPERWKSFQRDGYYRDKSGAIMLPIIVLKRDTLTKDRTVSNKLDANGVNLYGSFQKRYSPDNFYNNFSILNNKKPVKEHYAVAMPDFVTLEYSVIVQSYYMEQLNKIIEACEYASDSYWGNPERFKFRAFIDSFATETSLTKGMDRLVKGTFKIQLRGYIIPDTIQKEMHSIQKWNSKSKVTINMESTRNANTFEPDIRTLPNTPNMLPFKFTVNTALSGTSASNQFTIPTGAGTFLYDVTTDDGYSATGLTGAHTITFPTGTGIHTVEITGSFPAISFQSGGDRNKFSTIENFGIYGINSTNQTSAFYGCSNLLINATDIGHLENVTNFTQFFRSCGSIISIPRFNTSSATTFATAFFGCGQLTKFPLIDTSNVTNLSLAFFQCSSLTEFPLIDTSNVTSLSYAFKSCSSLTEFPLIDTSSVTNLLQTWFRCDSMTSFPAINPINATSFKETWGDCTSLNTFPANVFDNSISTANYTDVFLNTNLTEQSIDNILVSIDSNGVSNGTFTQSGGTTPGATGLAAKDSLVAKGWTIVYTIAPNVPNTLPFKFTVNTAQSGTSASNQFTIPVGAGTFLYDVTTSDGYSATGLTGAHTITFPTGTGIHTVEITGSFPAIRFQAGGDRMKFSTIENFGIYGINSTNQDGAFYGCSNLLINAIDIGHLENVTNFSQFFRSCGSIISIPRFNTSSATTFFAAFFECGSLTEFPLIDTSNVTNLNFTFTSCSSLTEFPLIDVSSVTNFSQTWARCNSMTSFPAINPINATTFNRTWGNCASLNTFPANIFDNSISTSNYNDAFLDTNLTEQSIDNILVSIDSNGVSNGTFTQSGGTTPSATGLAAKDSLVAKGWTIVYTIAPNVPNTLPFKFTVNTAQSGTSASNQFTIPTGVGTFLYDVTTSDGYSATGLTGAHTITFPTGAGTHTVEITGSFPAMKFQSGGDKLKFSTIENFGIYGINSLSQNEAFHGCSNLLINAVDIGHLENVTNFTQFFQACGSITSIPRFNTSSATTLEGAFLRCSLLAEFPLIDTSNVTNFSQTWFVCSSLTEFPLIDTSSGTNFSLTWVVCSSLTEFPAINPISATSFNRTWGNCTSLETFSANIFDNSISASNYSRAFESTNLTEQSIDNILVSIDSNGVSNGTFTQSGGSTPGVIGIAAKDSLVAKGWTIVYTT